MKANVNEKFNLDWLTIFLYIALVGIGWINIFASGYDVDHPRHIIDLSTNAGKQLLWIVTSLVIAILILISDHKFYNTFAYLIYGIILFFLFVVLILARDISGAKSWLEFGFVRFQPSEFAKFATALAVARFLSNLNHKIDNYKNLFTVSALIIVPAGLIFLQNDTGSSLVFSIFLLVLYREGLSSLLVISIAGSIFLFIITLLIPISYLIGSTLAVTLLIIFLGQKKIRRIGNLSLIAGIIIGFMFGVKYVVDHVLKKHQRDRIYTLVNPNLDPLGKGWNVTQSKIAIGSGGFWGKGFKEGTQTKYDFVPEQSTDFIFCTIGEEHGFIGSIILIGLYLTLLIRLVSLAERQKSRFARIYGYGVLCIILFHFTINIGMTIGLAPVIGIPLPFVSYGGSSLWAFTILLMVFLKLDAHRDYYMFSLK